MNHPEVRRRMGEYLQGDLNLAQRALFDAHLDGCEDCARDLRDLRTTVHLLRDLPDPEAPPHLTDRIVARIEDGEGQARWWDGPLAFWNVIDPSRFLPPLAAAALTSAAVIVGVRDFGLELPGMQSPDAPAQVAQEAEPPRRLEPASVPPRRTTGPIALSGTGQPSAPPEVVVQEFRIRGPVGASEAPVDFQADEAVPQFGAAASPATAGSASGWEEVPVESDILRDHRAFLESFRQVQKERQDEWLERRARQARQADLEELMRQLRTDAGPEGQHVLERMEQVGYPGGG